MTDERAIEKIFGELLTIGNTGDFHFNKYQGSWGPRSMERFQTLYVDFIAEIERLAKACSIKFYEGQFYLFDNKIYVPIREELVLKAAMQFVMHMRILPMAREKTVMKDYFVSVIRYYNLLMPRKDLIAFTNGVLDLKDFHAPKYAVEFHEGFSPKFHVTYYHPYPYEPDAKCRMWQNFLHEVLPDKNSRIVLQMFLGLGLIQRSTVYDECEGGDAAKVELCLILVGSGANGKSVIYNTAMGIFGPKRISGVDYDELTQQGDEGMRSRLLLRNALFNWSSDSDPRTFGKKRTGIFKRIVSGEPVLDRKLGEDVKENVHMPYLVFNLNELPFPDDQSLGFIRRLQFVSFDVTIPSNRQNKSLSSDLKAEYPGIFQWVLRGAKELRRKKFMFPYSEGNRRQIILTQLKVNPVLAWITAYRIRWDPQARNETGLLISAELMMKSIEQFCEDNEADMPTKQRFGHTMRDYGGGFFKKRTKDGVFYKVYGITEDRLMEHFFVKLENMACETASESMYYIKDED